MGTKPSRSADPAETGERVLPAYDEGDHSDAVLLLRKPVNTLAIVPKSNRITTLGRKSYNVLLYLAQEQGLEKDAFRAPLDAVMKGVNFDSNDHALVKKHLRAMVSTTVEWQSPTTGEGTIWNVSGLLAHARLTKEAGQVWVEWSYAQNLKQELLQPTVFARLKLNVISQFRSHAAVVIYEICTRYRNIGRTSRQPWRWWVPVLTGNPKSEKTEKLEYRIFKRDTLKPAIAEVMSITDLDIELQEYKDGRAIGALQFYISVKKQASLPLSDVPGPVDLALVGRAQQLGVSDDAAEAMIQAHGEAAFRAGLDSLERRQASSYPEPLRDPSRYLRALMPGEAAKEQKRAEAAEAEARSRADPQSPVGRELQAKRQARWLAEWTRRRHEQCARDIEALSGDSQRDMEQALLRVLRERQAHPSIVKRLELSGWQHPMVRHEMLRFFGTATYGDQWDKPTAAQLLEVAAEMGEGGET